LALLSAINLSIFVSGDSRHTRRDRLLTLASEMENTEMTVVVDRRGNAFRIDVAAFRENVGRARGLLRAGSRLFQVVKGDGYGLGIERTLQLGLLADVDGFCAGTPEEALAALPLAGNKPVILFTACLPAELARIARPGLIVTVNSPEALKVVQSSGGLPYLLELDCGFGRFGLDEAALDEAVAHGLDSRCLGAYTHFGSRSFDQLEHGLEQFDAMLVKLRSHLGDDIITMAAASHTMVWRSDLDYSAADPGSLLYGLLPKDLAPDYAPVVPHVTASLLQINRIDRAQTLSIGYDSQIEIPAGGRTGVFGLGWRDGLPSRSVGVVLVNGRRAPVIGRTLLHSIVDLSGVPGDISVGDEIVLVGSQWGEAIDLAEAAKLLGISPTQFHFQILGAIARPAGSLK
jgi:alanine racemase